MAHLWRCQGVVLAGAAALLLLGSDWTARDAQAAGGRQALVIGNAAYDYLTPLDNPVMDASLLAATLERRGFAVERVTDADYEDMRAAVDRFRIAARGAEVALIYYAGHGVQVDGVNYLLPVDAEAGRRDDLRREALLLPFLLHELEAAAPEVGILVLDACRDNPVTDLEARLSEQAGRSLAPRRGLAPVETGSGLIVAYATAPGQVALDGPPGGNSPYAEALARYLDEPGLEIGLLFRKVSERVREATAGAQTPWTEASLSPEPIILYPAPPAGSAPDPLVALNSALDESDPLRQRLALARFVEDHAGSPAAAMAAAHLAESADPAPAAAILVASLETTVADWQRVALVAGGEAEPFANELFAERHGAASPMTAGTAPPPTPARPSAQGPEAASLLWPLVEASGRGRDYARFLTLFPDALEAGAAGAGVALAALDLPSIEASARRADGSPGRRVTVVVGTGAVDLPLPAAGRPLRVLEAPRHGRLRALDPAGAELPLGDQPVAAARLIYEPPLVMRTGVDRVVMVEAVPTGPAGGLARSVDARARTGAAAAGPAGGPIAEPVVIQLEIGVDVCDREAGIRFDVQGVVLGKFPEELDGVRGVAACEVAVTRFPAVARFHFQLGIAMDLGGDPEAAVPHLETAALMGHWFAVNRLGYLRLTGRGLPVAIKKARSLFEIAAERGDTHAMNNLGRAYLAGEIVPQDRDRGVEWLREAAARGNSFAYNSLGSLLVREGDAEAAIPLFRQAAAAGDAYGHNNLAHAYEKGLGVEQDLARAIGYYEAAAAAGQPNAPINLGFIYRDGGPGSAPDPKRAAFWFAEAAKGGNPWGTVHLAALYQAGAIGAAPDPELAAKLLARVAWIDAATGREAAQQNYGGAGDAARQRFAQLPVRVVAAAVQSELARLGFDPGPVDGLPGPRTEAAIGDFASSRDVALPPDLPPIELLAELVRLSAG